jgi:hypothetical protein
MIQASKIIGTGLATTGLIGAGIGIGVVFGVRLGCSEAICKRAGNPILLITMRIVIPAIILGVPEKGAYKHSMIIKVYLPRDASLHMVGQAEILTLVKAILLEVYWRGLSHHRGN